MHIILVHPQIPQNTGSIARTCAATDTSLHLIHPMGFEIDEKKVRRAGLDYWPHVNLTEHDSFEDCIEAIAPDNLWLLSTHGKRTYSDAQYSGNDALIFGSETRGLGPEFIANHPADSLLTIPQISSQVRSLNLSNAVSIVLYEALRQLEFQPLR